MTISKVGNDNANKIIQRLYDKIITFSCNAHVTGALLHFSLYFSPQT